MAWLPRARSSSRIDGQGKHKCARDEDSGWKRRQVSPARFLTFIRYVTGMRQGETRQAIAAISGKVCESPLEVACSSLPGREACHSLLTVKRSKLCFPEHHLPDINTRSRARCSRADRSITLLGSTKKIHGPHRDAAKMATSNGLTIVYLSWALSPSSSESSKESISMAEAIVRLSLPRIGHMRFC
jgi:hypothetical protein